MTKSPALRKPIFAVVLAAALLAPHDVEAQQGPNGNGVEQGSAGHPQGYYLPQPRDVGGYSMLRFSDIWGPAKMPSAPTDFGPHFDYPPESLNSTPLHDPYPN